MKKILFPIAALLLLSINFSFAQTPRTLSYQGVLIDAQGNPKPDGQYNIVFRIYFNETGGIAQWTESKFITAAKGLFSTLLGDSVSFPPSMKWDAPYWISIQVDAGNELSPRIKLATTAYSFRAIIADNAVTVFDGAITASKLAPNSVTSDAIQDGSVQMSDIAQAGATTGQAIVWNGSQWSPATVSSGGSFTAGAGIGIAGNVISNTGDLSNTNEIQTVSLAGNQLSLSNGGGSVTLPGGGGSYTAGAGINIAGNVISNTGDISNTNEIQALSLAGDQLSLSNGGGSVTLPAGGGTNYWTASGTNISNNNSGYVGIGTATPQWKLDLQADGAAFRIDGVHPWMELWDGGVRGGYFRNLNGNVEIGTVGSNTTGSLAFWANGIESMRLSSGKLGLGTTTPAANLHIENAVGEAIRINGLNPWMEIWNSGTRTGFFRSDNGLIQIGTTSNNTNGNFSFWSGGKENMRLTKDGRLGIGTVTPAVALQVQSDHQALRLEGVSPYLQLANFSGKDVGYVWQKNYQDMEIGISNTNPTGVLSFANQGIARMYIDAGGDVGIGGMPNYRLHVFGEFAMTSSGTTWQFWGGSGGSCSGSGKPFCGGTDNLYLNKDGQTIARIDCNGSWCQMSDRKLKTNINPYHSVMDGVTKLEVVTFQYKSQPATSALCLGLIAQNVRDYFPELVGTGHDKTGEETLSVSYAQTGVIALKAVQEQQILIEKLTHRVEELEKRLSEK